MVLPAAAAKATAAAGAQESARHPAVCYASRARALQLEEVKDFWLQCERTGTTVEQFAARLTPTPP